MHNIIFGLIRAVIIVVGIYLIANISFCDIEDEETTQEIADRLEREACRTNSTAYHKCSWSFWEDRCVCKQR